MFALNTLPGHPRVRVPGQPALVGGHPRRQCPGRDRRADLPAVPGRERRRHDGGQPLPYVTANGFFTTFVNVGGTGATLALALILAWSKDAGFRKVGRLSLPTQIFQINEPIFFGLPIVLNPVFMVPYVLNALVLTTGSFLLMSWGVIHKPFINVPWTTPPIIGHYLVTGGDWRAAVWGAVSLAIAMGIYYPFARAAERARFQRGDV